MRSDYSETASQAAVIYGDFLQTRDGSVWLRAYDILTNEQIGRDFLYLGDMVDSNPVSAPFAIKFDPTKFPNVRTVNNIVIDVIQDSESYPFQGQVHILFNK